MWGWRSEHRAGEISAGLGGAGWAGSGGGRWHSAAEALGSEHGAGEVSSGLGSAEQAGINT